LAPLPDVVITAMRHQLEGDYHRVAMTGDRPPLEVQGESAAWPSAGALAPAEARVELMLRL